MFILQITLRSENRVRTIVLLLRYESSFFNMIVCHKFEATPLERSANIVVVGFVYTMKLIGVVCLCCKAMKSSGLLD